MKLAERKHLALLADMGCIACLLSGHQGTPAEIHHIRHGMGLGQRNDHFKAIPLCPAHHRGTSGNKIASVHGAPNAFALEFGTELQLLSKVNELLGAA